jgi:hypothetical protein
MHTGQLGEYSPSLSELARLTGWKPTPVKKYLGELEQVGWLIRDQPPVKLQRSEKAKTKYTVRIPGEPPDMSALSRPPRDLEGDVSGLSRPPDDHGVGRHATGARSPRGHRSDSQTDQTLSAAAATIRGVVPGVTDDEIEALIAKITPSCRTGNVAAYLAGFQASDLAAQIAAVRTERKRAKQKADKADVARWRTWASKQPECEHGQPGGDLIGPDGIAPCPSCRQSRRPT